MKRALTKKVTAAITLAAMTMSAVGCGATSNGTDANTATSTEATESAILIRQGDEKLQAEINKALKTLKDNGKLSEISIKYFGEDITSAK